MPVCSSIFSGLMPSIYIESTENGENSTCRRAEYEAWSGEAFPNSPYDATRHMRALAEPGWVRSWGCCR